jgi:hypothetical protein
MSVGQWVADGRHLTDGAKINIWYKGGAVLLLS